MLHGLARWGRTSAIWLSALGFGLSHHDILQGISAVCAGLFLGHVAWNYGVVKAIVIHIFLNSWNTFASWVAAPDTNSQQLHGGNVIVALVTLVSLITALVWLLTRLKNRRSRKPQAAGHHPQLHGRGNFSTQTESLRLLWMQPLLWLFLALEIVLTMKAMMGG